MGGRQYKTDREKETDLAATVFLIQWALAKGQAHVIEKRKYTRSEAWAMGIDKECLRAMRRKP